MTTKKDRWSQLSMQQRADFSNIAIKNGIRNRKDIIKLYNSFGDGGNTDSKREMAEIDADYFLRGWYNNPTTQAMMDQLDTRDYSKYPVVTPNGKEVTDPHLARRVRVSSALNTPVNYVEFPENKGGEFVFRNSIPKDNDININQDLWGNALISALVHEGDHAVQYEMPFVLQTTQPVKHELKAGYLPDKYLDSRKEIRSRIMSTREALNLDPNKRDYTPEEAAAIQQQLVDNKHLHRDNAQLDRLTPETMAGYLNYLADSDVETEATTIGGVRSAKHGGRILSGEENTDTALNSIKPLNREEYLQKQRDNVRLKALENSLNRTEPSNPLFDNIPYDIWQQDLLSDIDQTLNDLLYVTSEQERTLQEARLESLRNAKYEPVIIGNNCIYTALDNYGDKYKVSGNLSFLADPAKYGFKEIDAKDVKPGDLVQYNKAHMMLFDSYDENGIPLYNYSSSRTRKAADIKKKHPYKKHNIKDNPEYKAFTFIGLPEDIELWNSNYDNYKHDYSKSIVEQLKTVSELPKDTVKILSDKKLTKKSK